MKNYSWGIVGATGRMGNELLKIAPVPAVLLIDENEQIEKGQPDVIFDFSLPEAQKKVIATVQKYQCALVSGTTALTEEQEEALRELAQSVPVVRASNYSLGITIMTKLLRQIAPMLVDWDAEILETHHSAKKDSPSGTALALERALGRTVSPKSLRLGGLPGDHEVFFANGSELLTISHRAIDRSVFARGAWHAGELALAKGPGFYSFEELITLEEK